MPGKSAAPSDQLALPGRSRWRNRLAGCLSLAVLLFGGALTPAVAAEPQVYVFGVAPQREARVIHDVWRPILDEVEKHTGVRFELVTRPTRAVFEHESMEGRFDLTYMNPYLTAKAIRAQGYIPLVRDVKKKLSGIIVVHKDSPIRNIRGLEGKVVAFPDPVSFAASLLPRAFLARAEIDIKPRYVQSHGSVFLNVALGQVDAGAGAERLLDEQPLEVRDKLRIVDRTPTYAAHPVSAHPRVPAAVRERVQAAFLALGDTAEGRKLVERIPVSEIGPAAAGDYTPLLRLGLEKFYVAE